MLHARGIGLPCARRYARRAARGPTSLVSSLRFGLCRENSTRTRYFATGRRPEPPKNGPGRVGPDGKKKYKAPPTAYPPKYKGVGKDLANLDLPDHERVDHDAARQFMMAAAEKRGERKMRARRSGIMIGKVINEDPRNKIIQGWMKGNGGKLRWATLGSGVGGHRGMIASEPIPADAEIMFVPPSFRFDPLALCPRLERHLRSGKALPETPSTDEEKDLAFYASLPWPQEALSSRTSANVTWRHDIGTHQTYEACLALALLHEATKDARGYTLSASFWKPWILTLPDSRSMCSGVYQTDRHMAAWQTTDGKENLELVRAHFHKANAMRAQLVNDHPLMCPKEVFSEDALRWALASISSRYGDAGCMPVIDLINHAFKPEDEARRGGQNCGLAVVGGKGQFLGATVVATRDIDKGEELLINYAAEVDNEFNDYDMVNTYGFTLPHNPQNTYELSFEYELDDGMMAHIHKLPEFMQGMETNSGAFEMISTQAKPKVFDLKDKKTGQVKSQVGQWTFNLLASPARLPKYLLPIARLTHDFEEGPLSPKVDVTQPLPYHQEKQVLQSLFEMLREAGRDYETTHKEDAVILEQLEKEEEDMRQEIEADKALKGMMRQVVRVRGQGRVKMNKKEREKERKAAKRAAEEARPFYERDPTYPATVFGVLGHGINDEHEEALRHTRAMRMVVHARRAEKLVLAHAMSQLKLERKGAKERARVEDLRKKQIEDIRKGQDPEITKLLRGLDERGDGQVSAAEGAMLQSRAQLLRNSGQLDKLAEQALIQDLQDPGKEEEIYGEYEDWLMSDAGRLAYGLPSKADEKPGDWMIDDDWLEAHDPDMLKEVKEEEKMRLKTRKPRKYFPEDS